MNRIILNETSYHGAGAVKEIVNELAHRGLKKPIVFSDPDLIKFGVTKKVTDLLDKAKVKYAVYSEIKPNPTIANVKNGVKAFKAAKADCIVAIGGGSSMDTAKAVGIIIANPKFADVRSLEGVAPTKNPSKPILAVPTTAGTAAEVTINYVITDVEKKRKFVCVDPHDIPVVAFVDPEMMSTMPKGLTAFTGMDALTHAIEGYITKAACPMTDMMHLEAIRLISLHLRDAVANKPSGREGMALGQYIAGMGFSNVGLGARPLRPLRHAARQGMCDSPPHGNEVQRARDGHEVPQDRRGDGREGRREDDARPGSQGRDCGGREALRRRGHPAGPQGRPQEGGRAVPRGERLRGRLPSGQPARLHGRADRQALQVADVVSREVEKARR